MLVKYTLTFDLPAGIRLPDGELSAFPGAQSGVQGTPDIRGAAAARGQYGSAAPLTPPTPNTRTSRGFDGDRKHPDLVILRQDNARKGTVRVHRDGVVEQEALVAALIT